MSNVVHSSRLIDLISRPVPDILKPSYNFGGISLSQLMECYVKKWLKIRDSVADIVTCFSLSGIKTDLSAEVQEGGGLVRRFDFFSKAKENRGLLALGLDEEFFQFNSPLSELNNILTSYLKMMCLPARIPSIKFTGNPVGGLNSTNEGEIKTLHETVASFQESALRPVIQKVLEVIQISEFGEINNSIYFDFNPLDEMTDEQIANLNKTKAETDAILIDDISNARKYF